MNNAVIGVLFLAAAGLIAGCAKLESVPLEAEFICEDDAVTVERHAFVKEANRWGDASMWRIEYVNGDVVYYNQPQGETCYIYTLNN